MIIFYNDTELEIQASDDSYSYRQIMGENSLTLMFSLPTYTEIGVGAYCDFQGQRYTLLKPQNLRKQNNRDFQYTLILEASQALLSKYKYRDTNTGRLKFSHTAKLPEHLAMLVANLNQRDSGWTVGDFVDSSERTISYNHNSCDAALRMMAEAYATEWEVEGKAIHIRRVEKNKTTPLALSYGMGNGLKPGLGRTNYDNSKAVEILYVQGGERNINPANYGSTELLLPKSQALTYEGRGYISDANGYSIRRSDKALQTNEEDSLDCSSIYPSRVGTVSTAECIDQTNQFWDFMDASIPVELDYAAACIAGETLTVIFQTGMLVGRELEVQYTHAAILNQDGSVKTAGRRFAIKNLEIDGMAMPNTTFKPALGDTYIIFGMALPDAYVCNNTDQTGASWDMYRQAARYLYENEDPRFSFTGELDGIWAKKNWLATGAKLVMGGYVLFSDEQFQITGVLIRIMGIKQPINNPYKPTIELSNVTAGGTVSSTLRKLETTEVVIQAASKEQSSFTKRRYRDAKETITMLQGALLYFGDAINPIAVETMSLLVGDEKLQFRFVDGVGGNPINHTVIWDNDTKQIKVGTGTLQHMTLGIKTITNQHQTSEYKFWTLPAYESPALTEGAQEAASYYLYASCSGEGMIPGEQSGVFTLSTTALPIGGDGAYNFLLGILNSQFEDDRSYVSLYGFTEVLPGRITTDRIVSGDGQNFLDFKLPQFRIGNANTTLEFNKQVWDEGAQAYVGDGKLRLKGSLVQNAGGVESEILLFRGDFNPEYTYYLGDWVTSAGGSYKYINSTPSSVSPPSVAYWKSLADKGIQGIQGIQGPGGATGADGTDFEYIFKITDTEVAPATPATNQTDDYVPAGWSDDPVAVNGSTPYEWVCQRKKSLGVWSAYSTATLWAKFSFNGLDGKDGTDYEFVFTRTNSEAVPATPATAQTDDFIPTGWTDDPTGVNLTNQYEWVTNRFKTDGVWSAFTTPAIWAKFGVNGANGTNGVDGTDYEFIFKLTATTSQPATPGTSQANDYIPTGWTDNASGPTSTNGYEWVCKRFKTTGTWSAFSAASLWAKFSFDGKDGADIEFIFTRTTTATPPSQPETSQTDDYIPSGWSDDPIGVNATNVFEWACKRDKSLGVWSAFSTPGVFSMYGGAGATGATGDKTEFQYAVNGSTTAPPSINVNDTNPAGWSTTQPAVTIGNYLWATTAPKTSSGALLASWSTPIRMSAERGEQGVQGVQGIAGIQGIQGDAGSNGINGTNGIQGATGPNGLPSYFHIKYSAVAAPTDGQISETPNTYIGTYVDNTAADSASATAYAWQRLEGSQGPSGTQGIPGTNGVNGETTYLHIKYSNDGGASFTASVGETVGDYIGTLTNTTLADSTTPSDYLWAKIKGEQGIQGLQGIQGTTGNQGVPGNTGTNGLTSYFHIKYSAYASPSNAQLTETPSAYIGTYVDYTQVDSTSASSYNWQRFEGIQGDAGTQGIPGVNGTNGETTYLHIKYSNDGGYSFTANSGETVGSYIGTLTNTTLADSMTIGAYTWAKIKGETGADGVNGTNGTNGAAGLQGIQGTTGNQGVPGNVGANGLTSYFHIKYSAYASPSNAQMTETPSAYIGTYVDFTSADSASASSYNWQRFEGIQGDAGTQGIPGVNGTNGETTYLHIKYSNDGGYSFTANSGETVGSYIGTLTNTTLADSMTIGAYTWAKIKGETGAAGPQGPFIVFRGPYSASKTYGGSQQRIEVVEYGGSYYITRTDAGYFSGVLPTNTSKWNAFGGQFESIATSILFAELAYIENLGVKYVRTGTSGQRVEIDGATGTMTFYDSGNVAVMTLANGFLTTVGADLQNAIFSSLASARFVDISNGSINLGGSIGGTPGDITTIANENGLRAGDNYYWRTECIVNKATVKSHINFPFELTSGEVAAIPNKSLYVDGNGVICFKDRNGYSHILF